jgi:DNA-binding NarL/FixJ family response regulator
MEAIREMEAIRVMIVDDHELFRAGVRVALSRAEGLCVCCEASSAEEALERMAVETPDVLVTDISMPGMTGIQLAERVRRDYPEVRTLILSMHTAREYAVHALRCGAVGYLVKDAAAGELEAAIRAVHRGESFLSPVISGHLVEDYARLAAESEEAGPLTARQREVLRLIAEGLSTKAIARRLEISVKTAEAHRAQIMNRLQIHDIAGLVRYAIRMGLVSDEP